LNILFIRRMFLRNNGEFRASAVVQSLSSNGHEVRLMSAVWPTERCQELSEELELEILSSDELSAFDAIYVEGGYRTLESSSIKDLEVYVKNGGILLLADNDMNAIQGQDSLIQSLNSVFGGRPDGDPWSPIKIDENFSMDDQYNIRFSTKGMGLVGFERELVEGIEEISVGSPLVLKASSASYLLTATNLSSYLQSDIYQDFYGQRAWALLNHFGLGYAVLIGGRFTDRITFSAVPGNAMWLERLLVQLSHLIELENVQPNRMNTKIAGDVWTIIESRTHEKKSTAFKPLSGGAESNIVHSLAKSIAAMCNTDGGTVVIGQADDGELLGLQEDIEFKGKGSADGYQLAIRNTLETKFGKTLELLGVQLDFVDVEDKKLGIFTCPASKEPVYTRGEKDKEPLFYHRDGNATKELKGPDLVEYVKTRFK